jgi:hypothetical protein
VGRKILQDVANTLPQMFVGWRMAEGLESLAELPDGTLEIDVLTETIRHNSGSTSRLQPAESRIETEEESRFAETDMTQILYSLFYACVLALVAGCGGYLFATRKKSGTGPVSGSVTDKLGGAEPRQKHGRTSRRAIREAEKLSATYRLSDLEKILNQVASLEAWGVVVEIELTTVSGNVQMVVDQHEVELDESSLDLADIERFRRSVSEVGLSVRPTAVEGQYCVGVTGTWSGIADTIRRILKSIYGVGDDETVHARVFG